MKLLYLTVLVCLASTTTASLGYQDTPEIIESLDSIPQGWTDLGSANPDARLYLKIALPMQDHDRFEKMLLSVSSPDHEDYGNHLTRDEVRSLIKPRDKAAAEVLSWLLDSGIPACDIENNGEWINFQVSVLKAEEILSTNFHFYAPPDKPSPFSYARTLRYSVPRSIAPHIQTIQPTTRFPQTRPQKNSVLKAEYLSKITAGTSTTGSGYTNITTACNDGITPDCLRALYNVGNYTASLSANSHFGVCGYLKQYAKFGALDYFLQKYAPQANTQNFTYELINGGLDTQSGARDDDLEANLDIQYAASLGYNQKITYYSTGGLGKLVPDLDQPTPESNQNEPYLDFLTYMLALPDSELPQTITSSYGEDEQSVPEPYARKVCDMFGQLGLRGVSVLISSGDTGPGSACQTNDGKNKTRFLPIFPASCPYVTSVGGTTFFEPEVAVSFSSGGFSDLWERPRWQSNAVKGYLRFLGAKWNGLYNPDGRGFPDVAAQGRGFHIVEQDPFTGEFEEWMIGGTSASAPSFAALISLLNNKRLSDGKKPLGFLNPWLYSHAHAKGGFNDITLGKSSGCFGIDMYSGLETPFVRDAGWNATRGWDAVTGLGTPNFGKLLELMETHR